MIPINLLIAHFVGDFLLQSDWMALNKSRSLPALTIHVTVYSLCFLLWGFHFFLLTWWLHFMVDYCTSRCTSKLWFIELGYPYGTNLYDWTKVDVHKRHWFFVMIGLDQLIHFVLLGFTWRWLV